MEDLGQGMRLDHILMGSDATAAAEALNEFAAIHGRLHATTIGRQDEYQHLRSSLGPSDLEDKHYSYDWLVPTFYQAADQLGITPEPGVEDELAALKATLSYGGARCDNARHEQQDVCALARCRGDALLPGLQVKLGW